MNHSALIKGKSLPGAEEIGRAGYDAMMKGRRVYIPGAKNWLLANLVRFTPRRVATFVVKKISAPV